MFVSRLQRLVAIAALLLVAGCRSSSPESMLDSARKYLANNDHKAATIQIKNALQANPEHAEARFLLGVVLLGGGNPVAAEVELRKALALKHPVASVAPKLAAALRDQGQHKKLIDEFAATDLDVTSAQAELKTAVALAYAALGKPELSEAALKAALLADPDHAPALLLQALRSAKQRDFDAALATVDSVLAKSPKNPEAWKLKGDFLQFGKNQIPESLVAYRKAVEVKSEFVPGHLAILAILLSQANIPEAQKQLDLLKKVAPDLPQTRLVAAQIAYFKKDTKLARSLTSQLLKIAPNNPIVLQLAGAIELQGNSPLQAEIYLARVLQVAPQAKLARRMLATSYLRSGQAERALATLHPAGDKGELAPEMYSIAGQVYLMNGEVKKAEELFSKASKLDPKDVRKRTSLAVTHLIGGDAAGALGELHDISASDEGITADLALISAYLGRQDFEKALQAIDKLALKQPDKPLASYLRGRTQLRLKDTAGARKSFEQALAIAPTHFAAAAGLALMDFEQKRPDEAKKRFEGLLARDPKNAQALLALADLAARSGSGKDEVTRLTAKAVAAQPFETGPRLRLIDHHLLHKDFKQASAAAQNAVAALPDSPELVDALGRVQIASGEHQQAIATYHRLAAAQPHSPYPHLRLAEAHMAAKNPSAAVQSLRRGLEIKPDFLEAQRGLAILDFSADKVQDALGIARQMQKQRPKEAAGFLLEGDINAAQKKWDTAAAAYRTGLSHTSSSELTLKLYAVLGAAGKTAEASKLAASWLKAHPKDVQFLHFIGEDAIRRKDYVAAETHYATLVKLMPNSAVAHNNLAWASGKLKRDGAIAYARKAVELSPNRAAYIDTLATLLADNQKYAEAIELQRKAVALLPADPFLKLHLAQIYIKAGDKKGAKTELDALAGLGDRFPAQAEVALLQKGL